MRKIIELWGQFLLIEGKRYPSSYKITDVGVFPVPGSENRYHIFSKSTGDLLFPDDREGTYLEVCKIWIRDNKLSNRIAPSDMEIKLTNQAEPLFAPYRKKGHIPWKNLYFGPEIGLSKEECEKWIIDNCAGPLDRPFEKKLLEQLATLHPPAHLDGLILVLNNGEYYDEFSDNFERIENYNLLGEGWAVFRQGDAHYYFEYNFTSTGKPSLSSCNSLRKEIDNNYFLCKRVWPNKKNKTVTEFVDEASLRNCA
jgi:hypothetical protein